MCIAGNGRAKARAQTVHPPHAWRRSLSSSPPPPASGRPCLPFGSQPLLPVPPTLTLPKCSPRLPWRIQTQQNGKGPWGQARPLQEAMGARLAYPSLPRRSHPGSQTGVPAPCPSISHWHRSGGGFIEFNQMILLFGFTPSNVCTTPWEQSVGRGPFPLRPLRDGERL